jgi:hypothetical protein
MSAKGSHQLHHSNPHSAGGTRLSPLIAVSSLGGKGSALRVLPVDLPTTRKPIAVITLKNRTLSPVAELFIKNARAMAKTLGPRT